MIKFLIQKTPTGQNRGLKIYCTDINGKSTSMKRKSKKEVGESSKAKDAKTQKKRGRKVSPPISRPTLPMVCISFAFNLDLSVLYPPNFTNSFHSIYNVSSFCLQ
ncbi:hypothetical protein AABB24_000074 [Solanum stoloniferum]|uniref:Uncharacterized protein n=1 Tax=Solanum stoloniferum TaxID=62892 RepID=A0ABD2VEE1_9SOLN